MVLKIAGISFLNVALRDKFGLFPHYHAAHWISLTEELEELIRRACKKLDIEEGALFFTTLWAIWWHRSKRVMEDEVSQPDEVVSFAKNFCSSFLAGVLSKAQPHITLENSIWRPPRNCFIKVNFDGAIFLENNEYGWVVCARDTTGSCVAWLSCRQAGNPSPELAEMFAACAAIDLIQRRGWNAIILEGDCKTLLEKLEMDEEDFSKNGNFVQNIKDVLVGVSQVRFSCVRRNANNVALLLARRARNYHEGELDIPDFVYSAFVLDVFS